STTATDANGGALSITLAEGPEWLTLTDNGDGTADLSGTPGSGDSGFYEVELTVTDNPSDGSDTLAFSIRVFPASASVILNEYDASGDWLELVVVGDGTAGSTVDMRGWTIAMADENDEGLIELSTDAFWEAVPAGTILLFSNDDAGDGGFDTDTDGLNFLDSAGWAMATFWIGDETYLNPVTTSDSLPVSNDDSEITILDGSGNIVFGPAGEGIASEGGVSSSERFQLTADPSPTVSPIGGDYTDSSSSTPGTPNEIDGGGLQSFEAFATGGNPNSAPYFTTTPTDTNDFAIDVPNEYFWIVETSDPNPSDDLTFTLIEGPEWMTLDDYGDGSADLYGSPTEADAGASTVTLEVSDGAFATTQTFKIFVFNETSPVIVNEFNGVDSDLLLDAGESADPFWGSVEGNGGSWFELVVVGDGSAESTVDLRGWKIEISEAGEDPEFIVLSQDSYWQNVRAGTVLTFTDKSFDEGGLDTGIHRVVRFDDEGWAWSNILVTDPAYVDQATSDFGDGFKTGSSNTRITLIDSTDLVRFGPAGEEFLASGGVGDDEVYKLEEDPSPIEASPLLANYTDGSSSTFGAPNQWDGGASSQNFSDFQFMESLNSQPFFTFTSPFFARRGDAFLHSISADDFDGTSGLTFALEEAPAWLAITNAGNGSGSLYGTPPESADLEHQTVSVSVSDGTDTVIKSFQLFVMPSSSPVIVNEYNAIDSDEFLNGGDIHTDDDLGTASDPVFGRIEGNGGDWFELVVVGDGTAGSVDLRGWTIEIADNASFPFEAEERIVLSNHSYWSAVPSGTILTFTEKRTAEGGLDSSLEAVDNLNAEGWVWSNIWIGDSELISYTDEATNGYSLDAVTGEVSGIAVSKDDTWFLIRDDVGTLAFGPVGEGIAPTSGIGGTEVFELEGHPTPYTSPLVQAADTPVLLEGYDDGSASTFGRPNQWNGDTEEQDFTPFIPASDEDPLGDYLADFGLSGDDLLPDADSDLDGATQIEEFAFGSNPNSGSSAPSQFESTDHANDSIYLTLSFLRRTGGTGDQETYSVDGIQYIVEGSLDLDSWNEPVEPVANPGDLSSPPIDYEWATYRLSPPITGVGGSGKGFLRVRIGAE
ncbi:MAG: hypothetical protein ACQKBT_09845, partial [Puniceicoccales bacterium]